jgi:peroxiredoxin Q/BCP
MIAVSTDSAEDECKFKTQLGASYSMVADPDGKLVALYDVKVPIVTYAKRRTFVIDQEGIVTFVAEGNDAIDPSGAIEAVQKLASKAPAAATRKP